MDIRIAFGNICQGMIYLGTDESGVDIIRDIPSGYDPQVYINCLRPLSPDILCFAEMLMDDAEGKSDMADHIAEALDLPHVYNQAVAKTWDAPVLGKYYGLTIMSRYRVRDYHVVTLPDPKLEKKQPSGKIFKTYQNYVQKTLFELPDGETLRCTNLHSIPFHRFGTHIMADSLQTWRDNFCRIVAEGADGSAHVITGDFNSKGISVRKAFSSLLDNGNMQEAMLFEDQDCTFEIAFDRGSLPEAKGLMTPNHGYAAPENQVDHILVSSTLAADEKKFIITSSDHPLLFCRLRTKGGSTYAA